MNKEIKKLANLSAFSVKEEAKETQNRIEEVSKSFFELVGEVETLTEEDKEFKSFLDTSSDEEVEAMSDDSFERAMNLSTLIDEKEGSIQEILTDLETTAKREGFKASRLVEYHDGRVEEDYTDSNLYYL